jgi:hypothetical protein
MERKIAGLVGAIATLGVVNVAQAAPAPEPVHVLNASSFADLLKPIPNALAMLRAVDEATPVRPAAEGVQLARHHHHHHHHHQHYRRPRHHHHHHHHSSLALPGPQQG